MGRLIGYIAIAGFFFWGIWFFRLDVSSEQIPPYTTFIVVNNATKAIITIQQTPRAMPPAPTGYSHIIVDSSLMDVIFRENDQAYFYSADDRYPSGKRISTGIFKVKVATSL